MNGQLRFEETHAAGGGWRLHATRGAILNTEQRQQWQEGSKRRPVVLSIFPPPLVLVFSPITHDVLYSIGDCLTQPTLSDLGVCALPGMLFGATTLSLRHAPSGACFRFDARGALTKWAQEKEQAPPKVKRRW